MRRGQKSRLLSILVEIRAVLTVTTSTGGSCLARQMAGRAGESLNQLELVLLLLLLDLLLLLATKVTFSSPYSGLNLAGTADIAELHWIIFD